MNKQSVPKFNRTKILNITFRSRLLAIVIENYWARSDLSRIFVSHLGPGIDRSTTVLNSRIRHDGCMSMGVVKPNY